MLWLFDRQESDDNFSNGKEMIYFGVGRIGGLGTIQKFNVISRPDYSGATRRGMLYTTGSVGLSVYFDMCAMCEFRNHEILQSGMGLTRRQDVLLSLILI